MRYTPPVAKNSVNANISNVQVTEGFCLIFDYLVISMLKRKFMKKEYFLFNFIPLLKIVSDDNCTKIFLFGFVLIFKIRSYDKDIYRLKDELAKKYSSGEVYVFYSSIHLCQSLRYRIYNIVEALHKRNIKAEVVMEGEEYKLDLLMQYTKVVINFRSCSKLFKDVYIEKYKRAQIPIIFDIDDLMFDTKYLLYHVASMFGTDYKLMVAYREGILNFERIVKKLKYGAATTDFLKNKLVEFNPNMQVKVIRNTINYAQYDLAQELNKNKKFDNKVVKITYMSGTNTHNKDFVQVQGALLKILQEYDNVEFHLVGKLDLDKSFETVRKKIITHPFCPYMKQLELMSEMDINIAPLELYNPFCDCKSELKIFEAALVLVPSIVSPVDSYRRIIKNEINGFLAQNDEEWLKYFKILIENPSLREKIARNAYSDFTSMFYIENNIQNILDTYNYFIELDREKIKC